MSCSRRHFWSPLRRAALMFSTLRVCSQHCNSETCQSPPRFTLETRLARQAAKAFRYSFLAASVFLLYTYKKKATISTTFSIQFPSHQRTVAQMRSPCNSPKKWGSLVLIFKCGHIHTHRNIKTKPCHPHWSTISMFTMINENKISGCSTDALRETA